MDIKKHRVLISLPIFFTLIIFTNHAVSQRPAAAKLNGGMLEPNPSRISREEKLVRATYAKLLTYHKAARTHARVQAARLKTSFDYDGSTPEFELSNFQRGPISEILSSRYSHLVSLPSLGEIITVDQAAYRENNGPEEVTYEMAWSRAKPSTVFERESSIGELFSVMAPEFNDVGEYASYEVTVRFEGKRRTYRALVVFHNPYGFEATDPLKPEFWDSVVGLGGALTRVWKETRPPFTEKVFENSPGTSSSLQRKLSDREPSLFTNQQNLFKPINSFAGQRFTPAFVVAAAPPRPPDPLPGVLWFDKSEVEHNSGDHHGTATYTPACTSINNTTQRCDVVVSLVGADDSGSLSNVLYSHYGNKTSNSVSSTGPKGSSVSCRGDAGVAFSSCLFSCSVDISLNVMGATATASGGNLWNSAHTENNTCALPATPGYCRGVTDYTSFTSGCVGGFADVGGTCGRPQYFQNKCYQLVRGMTSLLARVQLSHQF